MSSTLYTMATGRCPECHQTSAFKGVFELKEKCEVCGVVYMRDPGSWTGGTVVGYIAGSVFAFFLLGFLWFADLLGPGSEWWVPALVCLFILATFRFSKGLWLGVLHDSGYVYADPEPEEATA